MNAVLLLMLCLQAATSGFRLTLDARRPRTERSSVCMGVKRDAEARFNDEVCARAFAKRCVRANLCLTRAIAPPRTQNSLVARTMAGAGGGGGLFPGDDIETPDVSAYTAAREPPAAQQQGGKKEDKFEGYAFGQHSAEPSEPEGKPDKKRARGNWKPN